MITKTAYLLLCPKCGQHGKIVFAIGTTSDEFFSRQKILDFIPKCRKTGMIDEFEEAQLIEAAKKVKFIPGELLDILGELAGHWHEDALDMSEEERPSQGFERVLHC